ncbi:MAG: Mrp/NBP35 family ATP-binding protein [Deltaproteobacteria bacterium]|jgi:Mrp family chromosome partitioning ATPase|nr:Mrp/NBP35 family ATP-binding protein [Deltaproteobacteria bacterium]
MTTTLGTLDQRLREKEMFDAVKRFGKKYLILSGKGGVGKTTVAVNLAWTKAKLGYRVGLLDVDLHGPDLGDALFIDARLEVDEDKRLIPVEAAPNLWVLTIQHLLSRKDESLMWRGPRKMRAIIQFIGETAWPELDYFFIDSPPGTGDETLTVIRNISDLKGVIVSTGHRMAISDVSKAIDCLKLNNTPIHGLVDNFSALICPDCGKQVPLFDQGATMALAEQENIPYLGSLVMEPKAVRQSDQAKKPLVEAAPNSALAKQIVSLAEKF